MKCQTGPPSGRGGGGGGGGLGVPSGERVWAGVWYRMGRRGLVQ